MLIVLILGCVIGVMGSLLSGFLLNWVGLQRVSPLDRPAYAARRPAHLFYAGPVLLMVGIALTFVAERWFGFWYLGYGILLLVVGGHFWLEFLIVTNARARFDPLNWDAPGSIVMNVLIALVAALCGRWSGLAFLILVAVHVTGANELPRWAVVPSVLALWLVGVVAVRLLTPRAGARAQMAADLARWLADRAHIEPSPKTGAGPDEQT